MNPAQHKSQAVKFQKRVWLAGTADDVYRRGTGVCYNRDYGTEGDHEGERDKRVERASTSNNRRFAGVLDRTVTIPSTGEIQVTINMPGSVCDIALGADTVVDTEMLTCLAGGAGGAGRFGDKGFPGRGTAIPLQTVTAVLESVKDGTGVLSADGLTLTVSDSDDYTVGDTVVILAGEDDATGAVVPGEYTISSITNSTTIVLTASAVDTTAAGTATCSYYVFTGNPTALALLLDGDESGLVTWISPPNAGDTDYEPMMGGISYINGGITLGSNFDIDLPSDTIYGARTAFIVMGTLGSHAAVVDLDVEGFTLAGGALAQVEQMDAAADAGFLVWDGIWRTLGKVGGATEA